MGVIVGTAGWSVARTDAAAFPEQGTALERYSRVFDGVEINSSFHRTHRPSTWAKWAASVPPHFRFSVKVPKTITHQAKLLAVEALVDQFARDVAPLGRKLAILLVQLPPKLAFDPRVAETFFSCLQREKDAMIVCEPRHASWFDDAAESLLARLQVARAAADPALGPAAAVPGGWPGVAYWRLHGSPVMYRSAYSEAEIDTYATRIDAASQAGSPAWCIFDNTASSAATGNALSLKSKLSKRC